MCSTTELVDLIQSSSIISLKGNIIYIYTLLQKLRCKLNLEKIIQKYQMSGVCALEDKISTHATGIYHFCMNFIKRVCVSTFATKYI